METSLSFYRDLLGLDVLLDTEMSGEMLSREVDLDGAHLRLVELGTPGLETLIELLQYYSPTGKVTPVDLSCADVGAAHMALVVDDIQDSYVRLKGDGVRFTYPPQKVDAGYFAGHWTAYCFDPDGLIVELWQLPKEEREKSAAGD